MKPELTEAEHYQEDDNPSPVVGYLAFSFLAGVFLLSIAVAWQQGWV